MNRVLKWEFEQCSQQKCLVLLNSYCFQSKVRSFRTNILLDIEEIKTFYPELIRGKQFDAQDIFYWSWLTKAICDLRIKARDRINCIARLNFTSHRLEKKTLAFDQIKPMTEIIIPNFCEYLHSEICTPGIALKAQDIYVTAVIFTEPEIDYSKQELINEPFYKFKHDAFGKPFEI